MIKRAATLWEIPENEIEMSFDPIVSMLLSVCASEMEKISGEIDESQARITEKLIQLMTPEAIYGPRPAHAILFAKPLDKKHKIKQEYQFYYKQQSVQNNTSLRYKDIHFSSLCEFQLVDANIQYMVSGGKFITLEAGRNNKASEQRIDANAVDPSTLYLGITSPNKDLSLSEISFYFEFMESSYKELFYHHLRNATWFMGTQRLETQGGFLNAVASDTNNVAAIFEDVSNKTINIEQQTSNFYQKNYITVHTDTSKIPVETSSYPELTGLIESEKIKTEKDVRWIKIVFPRIITNDLLQSVFCSLNAFPILNRKLNSFSYRLREFVNILPIRTDDLFLDIYSIETTEGKKYRERSRNQSKNDKGTYILRADNMGKLDHRKAKEYLIHLIELLKDESAAFSFLDSDFLNANLASLNQMIALLEKKVAESGPSLAETNFAFLKPFANEENLLIEFWSTNGALANGIKSGSSLYMLKGIGVRQEGIRLLTTSFDGKDDPTMNDRLNSYRRSLLSRDRVVTKEDIRAVCFELYGNKIKNVEIKKGYTKDLDLKKGLVQCIEILIHPNNQLNTSPEEWDSMNSNLMFYLEKKSVISFPFKIKILI